MSSSALPTSPWPNGDDIYPFACGGRLPSPPLTLQHSLDPALRLLCSHPQARPAGWAVVKAKVSECGRGSQPREPGAGEGWTCPGDAWVSWGLGAVATALGSRTPVPYSIFPFSTLLSVFWKTTVHLEPTPDAASVLRGGRCCQTFLGPRAPLPRACWTVGLVSGGPL